MAKREIKTIFALDGEAKYRDAIKGINCEQTLLRAEMKAGQAAFDASGKAQNRLRSEADSLSQQIDLQKQKVAEAQHAVEQSTKIYGEASETTQKYKIDLANAQAGLGRLQTQLAKTNKELILQESSLYKAGSAAETAGKKLESAGKKAEKIGTGLSVGVTAPIVAAGAGLLELGGKFDDAIDKIRIGTGATGDRLQQLEDDFDSLLDKVPMDMADIADTVATLSTRLDLQGDPLRRLGQQYLEFSQITGQKVTPLIEESTRAFQAWGIPTDEMGDKLDMIFKISQNTGIGVGDLTKKVTDFAPALSGMGYSFDESLALLGQFEKRGLNIETMLAGFRKAVATVAGDEEKLNDALEKSDEKLTDLKTRHAEVAAAKGAGSKEARKLQADIDKETEAYDKAKEAVDAYASTSREVLDGVVKSVKEATSETEAIAIATELFGKKAGTDFAKAIREGKLDVEAFTRSIQTNTETINAAATDTYDYKEQWKMLSNQLARDLKPVAQDVFAAINSATPLLKKGADAIGGLAKSFSELSPKQQETILKLIGVAAAAGPVIRVTGTMTKGIGAASSAIGVFVKKLAEKKAAEAAAKLATEGATAATGGLSAASTGLTATLGPIALGLAAVVAIGAGVNYLYKEMSKGSREAGDAALDFVKGITEWESGVGTAKSALSGFNMEVVMSREKMAELETNISDTQAKIVGIAQRAAEESRAYTDAEREEIEALIGLISDYTDKKIEAYQTQAEVVAAIAMQERDVTLTRAQELTKGAQEARDETQAIAYAAYSDAVGLAWAEYDEKKVIDKAAYDARVTAAKAEYDERIDSTKKTYGDTLAIIQGKYAEHDTLSEEHLRKIGGISAELDQLEGKTLAGSNIFTHTKEYLESQRLLGDLADAYKGAQDAGADSWIAMLAETELYGGKIDEKTKELVDDFISSFDNLPEDSRKEAVEGMEGLLKGLKEKEPVLYAEAARIAGGIISTIEKGFDNRSPSHKMQEVMRQFWAGADKPTEEAAQELPADAARVAKAVLKSADPLTDPEEYIRQRVAASTLPAQLASLGSPMLSRLVAEHSGTQSGASDAGGTRRVVHSGVIRVEGVNDEGQLIQAYDYIVDQLAAEGRLT